MFSRQDPKHAKKEPLSFRPKGEILLRSLAFARDDGPRPVTLAPFASLRETRFSDLFFVRTFQISLASFYPISTLTPFFAHSSSYILRIESSSSSNSICSMPFSSFCTAVLAWSATNLQGWLPVL